MGRKHLEEINERRQKILRAAVQEYIFTGGPVSSERLVKEYFLDVSSATVRNDLMWLEEEGYLTQPHHSAGRIPTDDGYRFYVASLGKEATMTYEEELAIKRFFSMVSMEMNHLYRQMATLLAELTRCLGVTMMTIATEVKIKHFDLLQIGPRSILAVLIFEDGNILRTTYEVGDYTDRADIEIAEAYLSSKLVGCTLNSLSDLRIEDNELPDEKINTIVKKTLRELKNNIAEDSLKNAFIGGVEGFTVLPEVMTAEKILSLINLFNERSFFFSLVKEALISKNMVVKIGKDNPPEVCDFSFVVAPYEVKGTLGAVGVLGPKRMDYAKAIAVVRDVSKRLAWRLRDIYES